MLRSYSHILAGLTGTLLSVVMAAGLIHLVVSFELKRVEMSSIYSPRFVIGDVDPERDEVAAESPEQLNENNKL